jgi:hypothetical protein
MTRKKPIPEDKDLACKMAAKDFARHVEVIEQHAQRKLPIIGYDDPMPDVPGDGSDLVISFLIGSRGKLSRQEATRAAKLWRRHVKRYPNACYVLSIAGYDDDPRNLWEIEEAARYVRRWSRLAGLNSLDDADRYLQEHFVALLAACGAFGDDVKSQVQLPPKTIRQ